MDEKNKVTSESTSVSTDRRLKDLFIYGSIFLFAFAVAVASMTYYLTNVRTRSNSSGLTEGERIDLPVLRTLDGKHTDLRNSQKKYLLVTFFSSGCAKCQESSRMWKTLASSISDRADFYLLAMDRDQQKLARFIQEHRLEQLPVLIYGTSDSAGKIFKVKVVPTTVLLDKSGHVLGVWSGGSIDAAEAEQQLIKAMNVRVPAN